MNEEIDKRKVILYVFAVIGVAYIIWTLTLAAGYQIAYINCGTESMEPELSCANIIIVKTLSSESTQALNGTYLNGKEYFYKPINATAIRDQISVGDIVVWRYDASSNVVHRVVSECDGGFVTKGDNNRGEDMCVPYSWIIGKVIWHSH